MEADPPADVAEETSTVSFKTQPTVPTNERQFESADFTYLSPISSLSKLASLETPRSHFASRPKLVYVSPPLLSGNSGPITFRLPPSMGHFLDLGGEWRFKLVVVLAARYVL